MKALSIVMLGHGEIGRALESVTTPRNRLVIWERDLETWQENTPLEILLSEPCDLVLFALPAKPHHELAKRVHAALPANVPCMTIAKGLDDNGLPPAMVFDSVFGVERPFGVLYGPMIAEDLLEGRAGFATIATASDAVKSLAVPLFKGSVLHVDTSSDVIGASWAAILKNIYVPLVGIAEGLSLGDNMRGYLMMAALRELASIVMQFGGTSGSVYGLPGVGDFVTTATSPGSHHRSVGLQLASGNTSEMQASGKNIRGEGFHAIRMLEIHQLVDFSQYPLLSAMRAVLDKPTNARQILESLGESL